MVINDGDTRPGYVNPWLWKPWPIEIVDLPIEHGDFPSFFCKRLPEGNHKIT